MFTVCDAGPGCKSRSYAHLFDKKRRSADISRPPTAFLRTVPCTVQLGKQRGSSTRGTQGKEQQGSSKQGTQGSRPGLTKGRPRQPGCCTLLGLKEAGSTTRAQRTCPAQASPPAAALGKRRAPRDMRSRGGPPCASRWCVEVRARWQEGGLVGRNGRAVASRLSCAGTATACLGPCLHRTSLLGIMVACLMSSLLASAHAGAGGRCVRNTIDKGVCMS